MKTIKKLKKKPFRYLTANEIENPLFPLMELCCSETSLDCHRNDIHKFIRASCCHNTGFRPIDFGEMFFLYKDLSKHIELLYVLMHRYADWRLSATSPFYKYEMHGQLKTIHDEHMYGGTTMRFEALRNAEFVNLRLFMDNFFRFKSLGSWHRTMDSIIDLVFSDNSFGQYYGDARRVFEYLDKLGEAMFLAYAIQGKAYMLEHHADRFGIKRKKLVDIESPTTDG